KLLSDEIQIAVGYFWHRVPSLHYTPLFIERQVAYCGRGHPLFDGAGMLTPADVAGFAWAWRSYPLPEAQLSTTPDRVTATADNMEAVALLILSGHHLGYLPQHFAAPYVAQGLLAPLNPDELRYDVTFHMVVARNGRGNPLVEAFLEDLERAHQSPDVA
ncbi:MAG: substrate-binding domain-containing protein, partial [Burkholderia sp.]|nr:substrate-binding domain-containing protein [Burkholderia sp.]